MGNLPTNGPHINRALQETAETRALAAIAHELKRPLQVITNLLYLIGNDVGSASTSKWVGQACQELERIKQITGALLEASRQRSWKSEVEVSKIVENSLEPFQEKIAFKKITVEQRLEYRG